MAANLLALLITRFASIWKLGEPRPVTASQPGVAAKDSLQQFTVSIERPAPQAYKIIILKYRYYILFCL